MIIIKYLGSKYFLMKFIITQEHIIKNSNAIISWYV